MFDPLTLTTTTSDSYKIRVGYNIFNEAISFIKSEYSTQKVLVLIDENVNLLHSETIFGELNTTFETVVKHVIPAGEKSKCINEYSEILDVVLKAQIERKTPLLAIGGGVTGDLAGFVAASVLRGIPLIHIPTTLLAMVDSSIGGKTGINHTTGKNLIGAFYQPKAVFADLQFLETLPKQEWISGLSEILKYGFIQDKKIFDELRELIIDQEFKEPKAWKDIIEKSAAIKVAIVSQDVKEAGIREFLNFGHTFAHVIERKGEYKRFTHGEAVYMGMMAAVFVSNKLGAELNLADLVRFKSLYNLSLDNSLLPKELTNLMLHDKKVANSTIRLVLLEDLEKPFTKKFEQTEIILEAWKFILKEFN